MKTRKPTKKDIGKAFMFVRIKDSYGNPIESKPFLAVYQGSNDSMRKGWYDASYKTYHSRRVQIVID